MNIISSDRSASSAALSSSMSVLISSSISRSVGEAQSISSSQTKNSLMNKSPMNQFYCNICFCPLLTVNNINRASFVTSCGHFYCDQCAQSTFQGLMSTCKLCQCSSSSNLTCMDLRKKQSDDVDVMISSNCRARKWFNDQIRQRNAEQIMATLDQRNAFLSKQHDLCSKTVLKQADAAHHQLPFDKVAIFATKILQETKQASESSYKLLAALSQPKTRMTPQQQLFCQKVVERFKMNHK